MQNFIHLFVPLSDNLKIVLELPNSAGVSSCNPGWLLNRPWIDYGTKWENSMNSVFNLFCYIHLFKNLLLLPNKGNFPSGYYYYIACFTIIAMKVPPTKEMTAPAFESVIKSQIGLCWKGSERTSNSRSLLWAGMPPTRPGCWKPHTI